MNFKGFMKQAQFKFEKNKGLIFTIVSGVLEIAAVVAMAKQAPKAEKILIPANKKINKLKEEINDTEKVLNKVVSVDEHKKEIRKIQGKTFLELCKVYSIPVILTTASLIFMGTGYKAMKDKEIALGATIVTLENAFKSYRSRVKEKYGEEVEHEIYRDIRKGKKQVVDPDTGEISEVLEDTKRAHSGGAWELWFDAASNIWSKNGRTNYETLMERQKQANITLKMQGYIFLYDIFKLLDYPEGCINKDLLAASRIVGWIYDPYNPNRSSWVSFGISDELGNYNDIGKTLFDNEEKDVMLSFNCDGNIVLDGTSKESFTYYLKG